MITVLAVIALMIFAPEAGLQIPSASARDRVTELSTPQISTGAAVDDEDEDEDEVDPEAKLTDEIRMNISKLTSGQAYYDGRLLNIHYDSPAEFEPDHERFGAGEPENLEFRPPHVRGKGKDGIFCFAGHTRGGLLLAPRFIGPVTVEVVVQYQWVDRGSHFMTLVQASPDAFRGSDFGTRPIEKLENKKKIRFLPSKSEGYNKEPSGWVERKGPTEQKLEVAEDGKLTAKYNGDLAVELEKGKGPGNGRVGFLWDGVKFVVIEMKITGVLDREWARTKIGKTTE